MVVSGVPNGLWGPKCCQVVGKCSCVFFFAGVKLNSVSVQRSRMESFNYGGFRGAKYVKISLCMLSQPWLVVYNPHFSAQRDASDVALSRKTESCVQSCATCTKSKTPKWASLTMTAFFFFMFEVWKGCWVGSWPFAALLFFVWFGCTHRGTKLKKERSDGGGCNFLS